MSQYILDLAPCRAGEQDMAKGRRAAMTQQLGKFEVALEASAIDRDHMNAIGI